VLGLGKLRSSAVCGQVEVVWAKNSACGQVEVVLAGSLLGAKGRGLKLARRALGPSERRERLG
jgi:hypothetical protein